MLCGILEVLIRGEFMKNRGFTLIEVIFSITLIGLIAVTFLPMITFGFNNTIETGKFTDILFEYQEKIENKIDDLRDIDPNSMAPDDIKTLEIFGIYVIGHDISIDDDSSGEINMFLPKSIIEEIIPIIESPPVIDVRKNNVKETPTPEYIDLYDDSISLFVYEIDITSETEDDYLMSVYRWYMSTEMDKYQLPSDNTNEYFIVKEWNEAKKQLSYENSLNLKFIPNIKDLYNTMKFKEVKDKLNLSDEDFINTFGNRYIRYGVTPYSLRGRIGKEELSNKVYVKAPRIELLNAMFVGENKVVLSFKEDIKEDISNEEIDITNIRLNEFIGEPSLVYRDDLNHKRLIMEFDELDTSQEVEGNVILKGAVQSDQYGKISIWHNDSIEEEFTIVQQVPIKEWNFDNTNDTEGWVALHQINPFGWQTGGYIGGDINGGDPYCGPPDILNIHTDNINKILIRLRNNTSSSGAEIYFQTSEGVMNEDRTVKFTIIPNSGFIEYIIDVGPVPSWDGILEKFRIDPATGDAAIGGSFSIDYIKFYE